MRPRRSGMRDETCSISAGVLMVRSSARSSSAGATSPKEMRAAGSAQRFRETGWGIPPARKLRPVRTRWIGQQPESRPDPSKRVEDRFLRGCQTRRAAMDNMSRPRRPNCVRQYRPLLRHDQEDLSVARSSRQRVPRCRPIPVNGGRSRAWNTPSGPSWFLESLSNHFVSHHERLMTADANPISLYGRPIRAGQ